MMATDEARRGILAAIRRSLAESAPHDVVHAERHEPPSAASAKRHGPPASDSADVAADHAIHEARSGDGAGPTEAVDDGTGTKSFD